ncbi:MAG TPA: 1,4-alpha-glucan branching protein domain-containing protein [Polyangiaceae bacterium]|jgi:1,4-alpha-glucan branching enzyme|nr:1,4-alpha-glucan branching protein domain-containing protein [Polyangiaceae bacterium]
MPDGYLALVLHAHLPFVRHPEHKRHLEERWFYEALIECYLPLLDVFDRLAGDGVPFAVTMSVTPPLAAMMRDGLLRQRFHDHLERLERLAEREMRRLYGDARFAPVATFYRDRLAHMRTIWDRYRGDVLEGLVKHWDAGHIELMTCSATHAYLPGLLPAAEGIRPQLSLGVAAFERIVGRRPTGAWLAECAYHPAFDAEIARAGVRFTVLDSHGVLHATPRPPLGVHAPICSPNGVAFFGRDVESSRQVWSREEGYPGDAFYRDFYRDIGFDLPEEELLGEIAGDGSRLMTGLKYYRITGKGVPKEAYQPGIAREKAWAHAGNFVFNRAKQVEHLAAARDATLRSVAPPVVVAPYDAELYGHWWFEGPAFLEGVFRRLRETGGRVEAITLRRYLDRHPLCTEATPAASSWGAGGYGEVWVGEDAAWTWRHVHHATRYVRWLVDTHGRDCGGARGRALDQAIRELLLLQSSDWAFILKTGTATRYAEGRFRAHVHRLRHLGHLVETGTVEGADAAWLDDVCRRDNFLASMTGDDLRRWF